MLAIYFTRKGERTVSMKRMDLDARASLLDGWVRVTIEDNKQVSYLRTDAEELYLLRCYTMDAPRYYEDRYHEEVEFWIVAKSRDDLLQAARHYKVPEEQVQLLAESGATKYVDQQLYHDLQMMHLGVDSPCTYLK